MFLRTFIKHCRIVIRMNHYKFCLRLIKQAHVKKQTLFFFLPVLFESVQDGSFKIKRLPPCLSFLWVFKGYLKLPLDLPSLTLDIYKSSTHTIFHFQFIVIIFYFIWLEQSQFFVWYYGFSINT